MVSCVELKDRSLNERYMYVLHGVILWSANINVSCFVSCLTKCLYRLTQLFSQNIIQIVYGKETDQTLN